MKLKRSSIKIKGEFDVAGQLTIDQSSKICVGKDMKVGKNLTIDNSSKVYVYDPENTLNAKVKNNKNVIVTGGGKTEEQFWDICQLGDGDSYSDVNSEWKDPIINVSY